MSDLEGYDFSGDPAELAAAAGHGRRRQRPMKSAMVPVRFAPDMIAAVKRFAEQDGTTVSTWIRRLVAKEIERRQPPVTVTTSAERVEVLVHAQTPAAASSTAPSIPTPELVLAS